MQRRHLIKGLGILATAPLIPTIARANIGSNKFEKKRKADHAMKPTFFRNEDNEFKFLSVLGMAHYKFADIGELLAIRDMTDEADASSFVKAYLQWAESRKAIAGDCARKARLFSARDAYLRASTYYFAATYYLDQAGMADRFPELFKNHRDCWKMAAVLMDFKYEEFSIPYENTSLAGFFISHKNDNSPRPLCIFNNGSDGSILDVWTSGGSGLFDRGYNLLTFDGPGQGSSLFEKNLYFRYDWEKVITPVVDSVTNRKDVDRNKIVVLGISQGGYWVPRAAAFEKRIKAIIADPGVTNVSTSWLKNLPQPMLDLLNSADKEKFNQYMEAGFKEYPQAKALYNFRARPYGFNNPFDVYEEVRKYNLNDVADKIECPVIITSPDEEEFWPGQSEELFNLLQSPKQLIRFGEKDGANYHCEPKARVFWEQQVLDKLDEIIKD